MICLPLESLRDFPTKTAEQVRPVLEALTSRSLLVLSGAGLAVPIIPPMSTLAWQLALNYLKLGSYPARAASRSELRIVCYQHRRSFSLAIVRILSAAPL